MIEVNFLKYSLKSSDQKDIVEIYSGEGIELQRQIIFGASRQKRQSTYKKRKIRLHLDCFTGSYNAWGTVLSERNSDPRMSISSNQAVLQLFKTAVNCSQTTNQDM